MPFDGPNDKTLPNYVRKLSPKVRARWVAIFNSVFDRSGEAAAFKTANAFLRDNVTGKSNEVVSAKTGRDVEYYTLSFEFPQDEIVIKASANGDQYIEAVLTDANTDLDGFSVDEPFLYELADQINRNGIVGDFDHLELEKLKAAGLDKDTITASMKIKRGVAKAVKAFVEKGKLWIRASIDKRYKNRILKSKGLSLEGRFVRDTSTNKYVGGTIFGFTFGEQMTPRNPRALIANA